ncbi:MAG: CPBP family intramembrane metalloprotease [candidate division WOR-3 bacterium]|nr:MAG: CPBP family intramembrane metalloprotease [candidate division WOR-3 bacterium]
MLKEYLSEVKQLDLETTIIIIYSTFILLLGIYLRRMHLLLPRQIFLDRLIFLGILYTASPFVLFFIFKHKPKDFGISLGHVKKWAKESLVLYLIMAVILFFAFQFTNLKFAYPLYRRAAQRTDIFLIYQAIKLFHMFSWEFFFRGFMLFSLEKKVGKLSILIQTIPFAIMHYRKPQLEAYGSIFAGIFLGILGLRARSFLPCALLHFFVALTADILGILF